jgi:hypothetical protein
MNQHADTIEPVAAKPAAHPYSGGTLREFLQLEARAIAAEADFLDQVIAFGDRAATAYYVKRLIARIQAVRDAHIMLADLDREDDRNAR